MEIFTGSYAEFQAMRKQRDLEKKPPRRKRSPKPTKQKEKRIKVDLGEIEARISDLESQMSLISTALNKAGDDFEHIRELGAKYATLEKALAEQMALWEQAANQEEQA